MRLLAVLLVALTLPACAPRRAANTPADSTASTTSIRTAIPSGEDEAKAALERSPRHGEMIDVPYAGHAPLRTWVVYPERSQKAGVVLIISEIYGLSDWIRGVADQLAADGFIAVAPDLISGMGPGGGGTESAASRDDVVKLIRELTPEEAAARLDATRAWAVALPAANGKVATIGFCWGGSRSFEAAARQPAPQAAVVYYGSSPDSAMLLQVQAPVLGHYGGDDARVNATIEPARRVLASAGKSYEPHVYEGAGHGFLRAQSQREGKNLEAARQSWPRTVAFLGRYLE